MSCASWFLELSFWSGCGSKNDANEKNLSEATNAYLVKKGQLCLGIVSKWPVDLQDSDRAPGHRQSIGNGRPGESWLGAFPRDGDRIHALVRYRPVKAKVLRYELTEEGKNFYREKEVRRFGSARRKFEATSALDSKRWTQLSKPRGRLLSAIKKK